MNVLNQVYLENDVLTWLQALFITAIVLFLFRLLKAFVFKKIKAFAEKTNTKIDDLIADLVKKTNNFFLIILSVYIGLGVLKLSEYFMFWASRIAIVVLFLQIALWGNTIINYWIFKGLQRKKDIDAKASSAFGVLSFFARLTLWSILILIILDNMNFDISPLIASLGVGGVAVALATQKILGDIFCSLAILLDKPFVVGDFIVVDQFRGVVEYIGVKTTRLRSLQGEQIVISNADLLASRIQNFKRMTERRVLFNIGVTYETPYEKLKMIPDIIKDIIDSIEAARFDRAHFKQYGDFALIYEIVYYVASGDYKRYMDIQQRLNLEVYKRFEELNIEFAYPTQTLYINKAIHPENSAG